MATYINREEINVNEISVAVFNGDPFAVEDECAIDYISDFLESSEDIERITPEDDDYEFSVWSTRLDFRHGIMPRAIYIVDGSQLAFVLTKDNPYYDK